MFLASRKHERWQAVFSLPLPKTISERNGDEGGQAWARSTLIRTVLREGSAYFGDPEAARSGGSSAGHTSPGHGSDHVDGFDVHEFSDPES